MEIDFSFNPDVDLQEVDQFGYVDLNDAFINGVVRGDLSVDEENFNDIEDPKSVGAKPRDALEAIELGRAALKAGRVKSGQSSDKTGEA